MRGSVTDVCGIGFRAHWERYWSSAAVPRLTSRRAVAAPCLSGGTTQRLGRLSTRGGRYRSSHLGTCTSGAHADLRRLRDQHRRQLRNVADHRARRARRQLLGLPLRLHETGISCQLCGGWTDGGGLCSALGRRAGWAYSSVSTPAGSPHRSSSRDSASTGWHRPSATIGLAFEGPAAFVNNDPKHPGDGITVRPASDMIGLHATAAMTSAAVRIYRRPLVTRCHVDRWPVCPSNQEPMSQESR